jgi:Tol biopolymer transport system component
MYRQAPRRATVQALIGLVMCATATRVVADASILFVRHSTLMVVASDGSHERPLAVSARSLSAPAWSGAARKVAATCVLTQEGSSEICVVDTRTSSLQVLTDQAGIDAWPSWAPDGSRIVFASERNASSFNVGNRDIYKMDAEGGGVTRLTALVGWDSAPAWSPDGTWIAFETSRDGPITGFISNKYVYVMDVDGGNLRNLTQHPAADVHPDWSPDGSQVVFTSTRDRSNWDIYVTNVDGTNTRRLTTHSLMDTEPAWSPDGAQIAFQSQREGLYDIFVMDADGANLRNVTRHPAWDREPDWVDHDFATSVSPVGKQPFTWGWLKQLGRGSRHRP